MSTYYIDTGHPTSIIVTERKSNTPIASFKKSPDKNNMISLYMALLHCAKLDWRNEQIKTKRRSNRKDKK